MLLPTVSPRTSLGWIAIGLSPAAIAWTGQLADSSRQLSAAVTGAPASTTSSWGTTAQVSAAPPATP